MLVTGPTGHGKSTTLAAIVDEANRTRKDHILTIEEPIEFVHKHQRSVVDQREVGFDTLSYDNALKNAMREAAATGEGLPRVLDPSVRQRVRAQVL